MDGTKRLASFWSWLPAFRAVAESEHLPSASKSLNVTAPALSRSIRLLEDDLGVQLFDRVGRNIRLNAQGRIFLEAVRTAMRSVDEGLLAVRNATYAGPVRLVAAGPLAPIFVLPAIARLRETHPLLEPSVHTGTSGEAPAALLAGQLDLAIVDDPVATEDLHVESLCTLTHGIYCSPDHPLARAATVEERDLREHPFVVPLRGQFGEPLDAWPSHVRRMIGLEVTHMQIGVDACGSSGFLAALPDVVATRAGLHRLPIDLLPSTTLMMLHRTALAAGGRIELVAESIRHVAAQVIAATGDSESQGVPRVAPGDRPAATSNLASGTMTTHRRLASA